MEVNREKGSIGIDGTLYTAVPYTRHNPECKYANTKNSGSIASCDCRKSILVWDGSVGQQKMFSAHTRSWSVATAKAEEWLDQFDPTKREQARQDAAAVTVEKAINSFIADKKFQKISHKTLDRNRALLGDTTAENTREGKLLPWLAAQNPPIRLLSEITPTLLMEWRNAWEVGDLTAYMAWGTVKEFFKFCVRNNWIVKSPAEFIKRPGIEKGNRTAIFTDKQYEVILKKAGAKNEKLTALVLLLRWSAMSITDAVQFSMSLIDNNSVLRYKREKTGILAVVRLPKDVVAALRNLGEEQPFRRTNVELDSNIHEWRQELQDLFTEAGIETVDTEVGKRKPHPSMFRDTCIVWYLRKKMTMHSAAKILGHNNTLTIQKHYLPFVKELQDAVIDETEAILTANGAD